MHDPYLVVWSDGVRLPNSVAHSLAVDQNAHVFAQGALIIQHVGAETLILSKHLFENLAHCVAGACHAWAIDMASQVRSKVDGRHEWIVALLVNMTNHPLYLALLCRRALLAGFAVTLCSPARAHSYKHGDVRIGHAWALPTTLMEGQAFLPLVNTGRDRDALVAARSDIAHTIELRRNARYDDPPEPRFDLDPNRPLAMRPQARHLRLIGLAAPLVVGDRFSLILDFEIAGEVGVEVHVESSAGD